MVQPGIPQNVGAVGRLCAANGVPLHVVRPIPFRLNDRSLQRAGMDYLEFLELAVHNDWAACCGALAGRRRWLLSSRGETSLFDAHFAPDDVLVMGSESAGLPDAIWQEGGARSLRIPMLNDQARCLNLATAAAVALYELLRQTALGPQPSMAP